MVSPSEKLIDWCFKEGFGLEIELDKNNALALLNFVNKKNKEKGRDNLHFRFGNRNKFLDGANEQIQNSSVYQEALTGYNNFLKDIGNDSVQELIYKDAEVRSNRRKIEYVTQDKLLEEIDRQLRSEEKKVGISQLAPPTQLSREIKRTGEYSPLFSDIISEIASERGLQVRTETEWNALASDDRRYISRTITRRLTGK